MLIFIIDTIVIIYFIYKFLSYLWRKNHPQYNITFIAAQIGAGKTCYAAKIATQHIKKAQVIYRKNQERKYQRKGWKVYSNDFIKGCGQIDITLLETMCAEEHSLIILDEASLDMNARSFAKTALKLIEYFKMSRHYKNKLILISQTFGDTDKQIRELSSKIYFIRPIFEDDFPGLVSMPVKVKGRLGISLEGQPTVQYKIGKIGIPYFLPFYYDKFKSYSRTDREIIPWIPWEDNEVI